MAAPVESNDSASLEASDRAGCGEPDEMLVNIVDVSSGKPSFSFPSSSSSSFSKDQGDSAHPGQLLDINTSAPHLPLSRPGDQLPSGDTCQNSAGTLLAPSGMTCPPAHVVPPSTLKTHSSGEPAKSEVKGPELSLGQPVDATKQLDECHTILACSEPSSSHPRRGEKSLDKCSTALDALLNPGQATVKESALIKAVTNTDEKTSDGDNVDSRLKEKQSFVEHSNPQKGPEKCFKVKSYQEELPVLKSTEAELVTSCQLSISGSVVATKTIGMEADRLETKIRDEAGLIMVSQLETKPSDITSSVVSPDEGKYISVAEDTITSNVSSTSTGVVDKDQVDVISSAKSVSNIQTASDNNIEAKTLKSDSSEVTVTSGTAVCLTQGTFRDVLEQIHCTASAQQNTISQGLAELKFPAKQSVEGETQHIFVAPASTIPAAVIDSLASSPARLELSQPTKDLPSEASSNNNARDVRATEDHTLCETDPTRTLPELTSAVNLDENLSEQEISSRIEPESIEDVPDRIQEFEGSKETEPLQQKRARVVEDRPAREMLVRRQRSESAENSSDRPVLETLTFSKADEALKEEKFTSEEAEVYMCPLCDKSYPAGKKDVLAHLVLVHKFVIADVNYIANLPEYLKYWKARFLEKPASEFCSKIITNTWALDKDPKEEFYLLCDAIAEDKLMREQLQRKKLESVLAQQQKEREETKFCRQCLFCKQTFCGNRAVLFDHLLRDHTFHMGQPDNLVYTDELFDLIQSKLDNQLCLFCEKSFKDKASLREHMRKKQHRKINPKNKEYDRFYIVNYMEMGKNWESLQSEDNRLVKSGEKDTDEEEEWSGWNEDADSKVVCLFCDSCCIQQADLQQHMKKRHNFDLQEVNSKLQLNFYQKVKLINYIRRQVYHMTCYGCHEVMENREKLLSHFDQFPDHIQKIPHTDAWDQTQYFFPTYEDDSLLCTLDDDDEGAAGDALGVMVIAESIPVTDTILKDQKLCRDLLKP